MLHFRWDTHGIVRKLQTKTFDNEKNAIQCVTFIYGLKYRYKFNLHVNVHLRLEVEREQL